MTPSHQTPPTITVYVRVMKETELAICYWDNHSEEWVFKTYIEESKIPDPSYINAIINDPGSNDDKVKRLSEYFNTFDNLKKY